MKRPIEINIHSLIDKVVVNGSSKEDVKILQKQVIESLLRVLNAANACNTESGKMNTHKVTINIQKLFEADINLDNLDEVVSRVKTEIEKNPGSKLYGKALIINPKDSLT